MPTSCGMSVGRQTFEAVSYSSYTTDAMSACVLKSNFISFVTLILFCFIKSSFLTVCGDKLFRLSPLHNDLNPVERPTKQVNVSGRAMCSTKCYNDVTCSGFFFRCDGRCSLFSTRFRSMSYVMDNGTNAYGELSGFRFNPSFSAAAFRQESQSRQPVLQIMSQQLQCYLL